MMLSPTASPSSRSRYPMVQHLLLIFLFLTVIIDPVLPIPHSRHILALSDSSRPANLAKRQSPFDDLAVLLSSASRLRPKPLPAPTAEDEQAVSVPSHTGSHPQQPSSFFPPELWPYTKSKRQSSISDLQIPKCALTCIIDSLTSPDCKSETDFACHCKEDNIINQSDSCVKKACNKSDTEDAFAKVRNACIEAGVDPGDGYGDGNDSSSSTQGSNGDRTTSTRGNGSSGSSTKGSARPSATGGGSSEALEPTSTSTPESPDNPESSPDNPANPQPAPAPVPSGGQPSASISASSSPTSALPMPTDTPLALLPTDRQLSPGAKAGISLSVSIFASAILITIALYIRRLKRDLKAAQAAAGVPESVWRASIQTAAAPSGVGRKKSWGGSRRGRSRSRDSDSPTSPLSPRGMSETGEGVLKKKRGHVLSVVVERVEEEDSSSRNSTDKMIREPVPGQKEGLVDPLELDGEYTGIIELPTSITPRNRSMERGRERGFSAGESSRPRTGELEKIDEKEGEKAVRYA